LAFKYYHAGITSLTLPAESRIVISS